MKFTPAFWNFYIDLNIFNGVFAIIIGLFSGSIIYGAMMLITFGLLIGTVVWYFMKGNQVYMYNNLGFTVKKMLIQTFSINLIGVLFLIVLINLIRG